MFVATEQNEAIKQWCENNSYQISDKDFQTFKKRLIDDNIVCKLEDVIKDNIRFFNIKCPAKFLNKEAIAENDADYIKIDNDTYLNINRLHNEIDIILEYVHEQNNRMERYIAWIDVVHEDNEMCLSFYDNNGNQLHDDIIINNTTEVEARETQRRIRYGMTSSDFYKY